MELNSVPTVAIRVIACGIVMVLSGGAFETPSDPVAEAGGRTEAERKPMKYFITNIEDDTVKNQYYRKVLFTGKNSQLVLMSLRPGEEIGMEVHELDQFIRFESGSGKVVLNGSEHQVDDGTAVVIPAGTQHKCGEHVEGRPAEALLHI